MQVTGASWGHHVNVCSPVVRIKINMAKKVNEKNKVMFHKLFATLQGTCGRPQWDFSIVVAWVHAINPKTATVWWWSTKRNCLLFIRYNVLIMLTLIMAMLMTKWWPSPNAKASPSSLQATADTGESRSSASRDTWSLLLIFMFWCFKTEQYWCWWTQHIMTKIISNTMVTLTLSGAWWPWICQRKACLKKT